MSFPPPPYGVGGEDEGDGDIPYSLYLGERPNDVELRGRRSIMSLLQTLTQGNFLGRNGLLYWTTPDAVTHILEAMQRAQEAVVVSDEDIPKEVCELARWRPDSPYTPHSLHGSLPPPQASSWAKTKGSKSMKWKGMQQKACVIMHAHCVICEARKNLEPNMVGRMYTWVEVLQFLQQYVNIPDDVAKLHLKGPGLVGSCGWSLTENFAMCSNGRPHPYCKGHCQAAEEDETLMDAEKSSHIRRMMQALSDLTVEAIGRGLDVSAVRKECRRNIVASLPAPMQTTPVPSATPPSQPSPPTAVPSSSSSSLSPLRHVRGSAKRGKASRSPRPNKRNREGPDDSVHAHDRSTKRVSSASVEMFQAYVRHIMPDANVDEWKQPPKVYVEWKGAKAPVTTPRVQLNESMGYIDVSKPFVLSKGKSKDRCALYVPFIKCARGTMNMSSYAQCRWKKGDGVKLLGNDVLPYLTYIVSHSLPVDERKNEELIGVLKRMLVWDDDDNDDDDGVTKNMLVWDYDDDDDDDDDDDGVTSDALGPHPPTENTESGESDDEETYESKE